MGIQVFQIALVDAASGAVLPLAGGYDFTGAEPFYLSSGSTTWQMR
jgi:hypothetical protein